MITDVMPILIEVGNMISKTVSLIEDTGVYIDIGCSGCTPSLPYSKVCSSKFALLFEPNEHDFNISRAQYRTAQNVHVYNDIISPENINEKIALPLLASKLEDSVFIADIDIDGYDFSVAQTLIKKIRPLFLIVEINESIPPLIKFEVLYDNKYTRTQGHFFGASICKMQELTEYGYDMVQLFFNTLIFIDKNKNPYYTDNTKYSMYKPRTANDLYKKQYIDAGLQKIHYHKPVEHWQDIKEPKQLIDEINMYFAEHTGKYELYT